MNFVIAACARVESQRLPEKIKQPLMGRTVFEYQVDALVQSDMPFVIVTPKNKENDWVEDRARARGALVVFRDDHSALAGMVEAGRLSGADHVVRVNHDDMFLDYSVLRKQLESHAWAGVDVTTSHNMPDATAFEIYKLSALERILADHGEAAKELISNFHAGLVVGNYLPPPALFVIDRRAFRLELDTALDLTKIRVVLGALGEYPSTESVIKFLKDNPSINRMNGVGA